jgi:hypothetical protein
MYICTCNRNESVNKQIQIQKRIIWSQEFKATMFDSPASTPVTGNPQEAQGHLNIFTPKTKNDF